MHFRPFSGHDPAPRHAHGRRLPPCFLGPHAVGACGERTPRGHAPLHCTPPVKGGSASGKRAEGGCLPDVPGLGEESTRGSGGRGRFIRRMRGTCPKSLNGHWAHEDCASSWTNQATLCHETLTPTAAISTTETGTQKKVFKIMASSRRLAPL